MTRKYVVTLEDTLKGWQEDEDELERKYGAEPLDCGNCEIVQAYINTGIRTASRLVDDALDKIRSKIEEPLKINEGMHTESAKAQAIALSWCIEIIDKYRNEVSE